MRSTRTIVFGCALIAVALVFWGILRAIRSSNAPSSNVVATTTAAPSALNVSAPTNGRIARAAVDIPAGSIVTGDMLEMKDYSGPSTTGFVTDIDEQAAGFITRVAIPKDSQIRPQEDFIGHISQVGIAGALRPGTRALVLPLPGKPTLHDLVKIGNSVDIIAAFDGQESRTIVEDVRVLAVDVFANDFPQVNAAMRGPYKADKPGARIAKADTAPGASGNARNAPPDTVPPEEQPTPTPENLPPLDPALTLEVTPQQAAAIQLALASQAPIDFLVRPALPGNRSGEATLISDGDTLGAEGAQTLANSVTKRQIAPYAEAVKDRTAGRTANNSNRSGNTSNGASNGGSNGSSSANSSGSGGTRTASTRNRGSNPLPIPDFPDVTTTAANPPREILPTPFNPASASNSASNGGNGSSNGEFGGSNGARLAPRAPSTYQIPIYSNGGVVRTETVPVPTR